MFVLDHVIRFSYMLVYCKLLTVNRITTYFCSLKYCRWPDEFIVARSRLEYLAGVLLEVGF